jgi:hypothetical protein
VFAITTFADIAILAALIAAWFLVVRLIAGDQPVDLAALFGAATRMPWPRGVQEEEPQPWRLELLDRRPTAPDPGIDRRAATDTPAHAAHAGCATG